MKTKGNDVKLWVTNENGDRHLCNNIGGWSMGSENQKEHLTGSQGTGMVTLNFLSETERSRFFRELNLLPIPWTLTVIKSEWDRLSEKARAFLAAKGNIVMINYSSGRYIEAITSGDVWHSGIEDVRIGAWVTQYPINHVMTA